MARPELTENETKVFRALWSAAEREEPCPTVDDLRDLLDFSSCSGTVQIVQRLEEKGLIEVQRFQRTRQVCIVATGKCTARPINTAPHWRDRPKETPSPSIAIVRERKPNLAGEIMAWAGSRNVAYADALADLVFVGWEVEKARG